MKITYINTPHHHQTNTHFQANHIIASTASSSSSSSLTNTIKQLDPINNKAETLTMAATKTCLSSSSSGGGANKNNQAITVPPDDEFFSMIQKIQSRRLDEQRTSIRPSMFGNGNNLRKMPMATETTTNTNNMTASTRPSQLLH